MATADPGVRYCAPETLGYAGAKWVLESGAPFVFDESYRLAHLPLVNRDHPAVIRSLEHLDYEWGRYRAPRFSLIVPVPAPVLSGSATLAALERDLRGRSFASKIAWSLLPRRVDKLHITLVGGVQQEDLPRSVARIAQALAVETPLRYRLGGPFVGSKNRGRIYFPAYPEARDGSNVFARLQQACGVAITSFYTLGYYNLMDELTPAEAVDLHDVLTRWGQLTLAEASSPSVVLLATHDDLALDSRVVAHISASGVRAEPSS